ncbi:hypothetical protein PTTG_29658 [Puccinia triticina 1-1 BBBD Race 1]|uniref:Uncharacterized protein n=1 Tax=Puccinia triticina (isolate 1-1 / race 1 (BBBD)) TaxID=630390 RepID=A0A180G4Z5_PUCT1|nr:hypothetical protein PTTG_29658 [Puccinia triticina 1-1 BBBD Race 1]
MLCDVIEGGPIGEKQSIIREPSSKLGRKRPSYSSWLALPLGMLAFKTFQSRIYHSRRPLCLESSGDGQGIPRGFQRQARLNGRLCGIRQGNNTLPRQPPPSCRQSYPKNFALFAASDLSTPKNASRRKPPAVFRENRPRRLKLQIRLLQSTPGFSPPYKIFNSFKDYALIPALRPRRFAPRMARPAPMDYDANWRRPKALSPPATYEPRVI